LQSTHLSILRAGQDTGSQPAAGPNAADSSAPKQILTDCPAELVLALLKQSRELKVTTSASSNQASGSSSGSQEGPPSGQPGALLWPPPALKQGLACTMELSQLSVAVPGTNQVCTVLGITNNLLSTLHSWQLVWQQRGMVGEQATRATLLNSTGEVQPRSSWAHAGKHVRLVVCLTSCTSSKQPYTPESSAC
jgi:hypothetical protein